MLLRLAEVKIHPQGCFHHTTPPTGEREALYQSQTRTCSGNDAELIAFNPDAADNLEASSLRQRSQINVEEGGREKKKEEGGRG